MTRSCYLSSVGIYPAIKTLDMNNGMLHILGILAALFTCYHSSLHDTPYDAKKGIQSHGTESGNSESKIEAVPEDVLLSKTLLRKPRYDVSVIYLKIQDYQILCIVNLVLIYSFFVGRFFRFSLIPIWYHCIVIVIKKFCWKYFFFMFYNSFK